MWILIEGLALLGLVSAMKFLGLVFGLVVGIPFFFVVTLPNVARRLSKTRLVTRAYENKIYRAVKCKHCSMGAQHYNNRTGKWGKIPYHIRMVNPSRAWFESPQANIRACSWCNGQGHVPKSFGVSLGRDEVSWPPPDGHGPLWQDKFTDGDAA